MKKTILCLAALTMMSSAYAQQGGAGGTGGASTAGGARPAVNAASQARPNNAAPAQVGVDVQQQGNRMENRQKRKELRENLQEKGDSKMERRPGVDRMDGRMEGGPRQEGGQRPEMRGGEMRGERMQNATPEQRERMEKRREAFRNLPADKKEALKSERQRHREEMKNIVGKNQQNGVQPQAPENSADSVQ